MTELTLIKDNDGIIDIQMNRPPVNALNYELVDALHQAIDLNTSNGAKGLILSGGEGIYSAGLDVKKLLEMNADEISVFFKSFWGLMAKISRSPIPIAAAITGHSPAGGAVLANFCDYRIAAKGSFKIGMNEVFVGLEVPRVIYKGFARHVGEKHATNLMIHGKLMDFDFAHDIGFIDELVEPKEVKTRALDWMKNLTQLPPSAMNSTRLNAKSEINDLFEEQLSLMSEGYAEGWFDEEVQSRMKYIAENL
tara:strand:+ start:97 stop:849 length:753 start_codon:yes stop_codon:yes gene_type:complete